MTRSMPVLFGLLLGCTGGGSESTAPLTTPPPPPTSTAETYSIDPGTRVNVGTVVTIRTQMEVRYWRIVKPAGSQALLYGQDIFTARFTPDVAGLYRIQLGDSSTSIFKELEVTALPALDLVVLNFTGTFDGTYGTLTGTVTYEFAQGPYASNANGLSPNVLYNVRSWTVQIESNQFANQILGIDIPSTTYSSDQPNNRAEFCVGRCEVSGSDGWISLTFFNGDAYILQMVYASYDPTPFLNPPGSAVEWGPSVQTTYRVPCPVCSPRIDVSMGPMTGT